MKLVWTLLALVFLAEPPAPGVVSAARLVLGKHAGLRNTIVVSTGQTALESGALLQAALGSVSATAESPCLIKIEPGVYDLGDWYLQMKPYVDLQGAGQGITRITSRAAGVGGVIRASAHSKISDLTVLNTDTGDGSCKGIDSHQASPVIRNVTVDLTAGCGYPTGIYHYKGSAILVGVTVAVEGTRGSEGLYIQDAEAQLTDVRVRSEAAEASAWARGVRIASGANVQMEKIDCTARSGESAYALYITEAAVRATNLFCTAEQADDNIGMAIEYEASAVTVTDSTALAMGGSAATGIYLYQSQPVLSNVTAQGTGGSHQNLGVSCTNVPGSLAVTIDHCRFTGSSYSIHNLSSNYSFKISDTKLDGPVSTTGTWQCVFCYDGKNQGLDSSCQKP